MNKATLIQRFGRAFCVFLFCAELVAVAGLLCLSAGNMQAQGTDRFYNEITGPEITTGNTFMVTDDRFRDDSWKEIEKTSAVSSYISLEINDDTHILSKDAFVCQVSVRIDLWNRNNDSTAVFKDLSVTYDPAGLSKFSARDEFQFKDAHEFRVTVLDIKTVSRDDAAKSVSVLPILKITGYLEVSRSLMFSCTDDTEFFFYSVNPTSDRMEWLWNAIPGAQEYDLEWTFYDRNSDWGQKLAGGTPVNLARYDDIFRNNATRVVSSFWAYELPMVFPDGYLFYRVRGARYEDGLRQTTAWSHPIGGGLAAFPNIYEIEVAHEPDLNWQTATTFAEDAKNTQTITYADALPRSRQEVSLSRADDLIIVKEQIYDFHGRPAVQVMPAPVDNGSAYEKKIAFVDNFAMASSSTYYSAADFDAGGGCTPGTIPAMDNQFGASKYYSPNNILANAAVSQSIQRFIPDAQGYPFSITEYTPDATGRIKRQGGVGLDFQTNTSHATRYFYGKASQGELGRLFGTGDVGTAVHYQKNMVQDANGQFSVSYVDANGRTIATALAGAVPDNLAALDENLATENIPTDLLNNIVRDGTISSTYTLLVSDEDNYLFEYDMSVPGYNVRCMDDVCYDCVYDLSIKITDNCSGTLIGDEIVRKNVNLPTPTHLCNVLNPGFNEDITAHLNPGEYTITKTLTISADAVEYYAAQYRLSDCMPDLQTIIDEFVSQAEPCDIPFDCDACLRDADYYLAQNPGETDIYNQMVAACHQFCEGDTLPTHCEVFYELLLADVSPGGQYMSISPDVLDPEFEDCAQNPYDACSFFYTNPNDPLTPVYQHPAGGYKDANGNPAIVNINGIDFSPEELSVCDFIKYWQPSWAYALVEKHPEYCLYDSCVAHKESEEYNRQLLTAGNFSNFAAPDAFVFAQDDYFLTAPGINHAPEMHDFLFNFRNVAPFSLLDVIINHVACDNDPNFPNCPPFQNLCTTDQELVWRLWRSAYLGKKYSFFAKDIADSGCDFTECIETGQQKNVPCPSCLANKIKRWRVVEELDWDFTQLETEAQSQIGANCNAIADQVVQGWIFALREGGCVDIDAPGFPLASFTSDLRDIFIASCDETHVYGATNVPPGSPVAPASVRDALEAALSIQQGVPVTIDDCSTICNDLFITFPGSWEQPQIPGGPQPKYLKDDCVCSGILAFESCYFSGAYGNTYPTFLDYFNHYSDVKLTEEQLDALKDDCAAIDCFSFSEDVLIPPQLTCGVCKSAPDITTAINEYAALCPGVIDLDLRAQYLNRVLGLNLTAAEYQAFLDELALLVPGSPCFRYLVLCPKSLVEPVVNDCYEEQVEILTNQAIDAWNEQVEYAVSEFKKYYFAHCLTAMETFTTNAGIREQQYTLYYYDRAGHLVKTVPPQGVTVGTPANHFMVTTYKYDCFGNAVERITPDGDKTLTWYDFLGRPVVSQDARQRNPGPDMDPLYSYTLYDGLGRPVETGEKTMTAMGPMNNNIARDPDLLIDWILEDASVALKDITRTYYDEGVMDWPGILQNDPYVSLDGYEQTEMRKRVATVVFMETYQPPLVGGSTLDGQDYDYATHYSYDIAGNVRTLVQDIHQLENSGTNRYKRIDYDYDIISGKVNQVDYQPNAIDQFTHRYTYDANNRLILVETSTEPETGPWEVDADYEYYYHGPLGRTVLGERKVQGTDYAYTLQGWIKGVNASAMDINADDSNIPEFLYIHDEDIPSGTYRARTAIISHGRVQAGRDVKFYAGKYITLEQGGFRADLGSEFLAAIDPALDTDPTDIVDMGRDGALTDPHPGDIARDAFSYTIGYFDGDYQKVSNNSIPDFEISRNYGTFYNDAPDLFNGNIRHIAQQVKTLTASGFNYGYDQLNRLGMMDYYSRQSGGAWGTTDAYKERVTYDRNGNIITYKRYAGNNSGGVPVLMDDLEYKYPNTNNNRLDYVRETSLTPPGDFDGDIDPQLAGNYVYDDAGNLVKDNAAGQNAAKTFTWSMYGKLKGVEGLPNQGSLTYGYDAMQKRVMKIHRWTETTQGEPPLSVVHQTRTFYIRDAQGNTLATYEQNEANALTLKELELYGSSRLGVFHAEHPMYASLGGDNEDPIGTDYMGRKEYELSNHLGNVLAVVRDEADWVDNDIDPDYREPRVSSAREYYPFGMLMPNRKSPSYLNTSYRYGFNGKESDDEAEYGDDGFQDYGMRMYMPGLGRFISVDPIAKKFPELTPYQFASNMPIWAIDLDGAEAWIVKKDIDSYGKSKIELVFDEQLEPINGVYEVTTWYDNTNFPSAVRWGTASYSDYPNSFPNQGIYTRQDGKPLITFEAGSQMIFGEVAWEVGNVGFEAGVEGNVYKIDMDTGREDGWGSFTSILNNPKDRLLKAGGGVGFGLFGIEGRKEFDTRDGTFTGNGFIEVDVTPVVKLDASTSDNEDSFKIGFPESKFSVGLGVKAWANISINSQPTLTEVEKREKKAQGNVKKGKAPKGTNSNPTQSNPRA